MRCAVSDLSNTETTSLVNTLFDHLKAKHNLSSDSALARWMGVPDMYIWRWRRGEFGVSLKVLAPLLADYGSVIHQAEIAA